MEVLADGRRVELGGGRQRALLALLLLHKNEVVSTDRLVEELWGERPPATAVKALQGHVSQLRRALALAGSDGTEILATRPPGYVLNVAPEGLDALRFEDLLGRARRLLPSDPQRSAELLREALALWRGEPLAEVAYEPFAQAEIARLGELRLAAQEVRVEADLMLGRHQALVPELEALVEAHPLRERLRSQLMLALYRSGRQADALEAYRDARHTLVDGLGVEPGPELQQLERAILTQDPALAPPPLVPLREEERAVEMVGAAAPRRRRRRLVLVPAAFVLAGAAILAAFLLSREGDTAPTVVPNSIVKIDPRTNTVTGVTRVGRYPGDVVVAGEFVWALNLRDETLSRLDAETGLVVTLGILERATGLAAEGEDSVWVGGELVDEVVRLDARTGAVQDRVPLPEGTEPWRLAVGGGSLWIVENERGGVVRLSLRTGRLQRRFQLADGSFPFGVAYGSGAAWLGPVGLDGVLRIDSVDGEMTTTRVGHHAGAQDVGFGSVWASAGEDDVVVRVSVSTGAVEQVIPVGDAPVGIATGAGSVWVANNKSGTVSRIDPRTNRVVETIETGFAPFGVAFGSGVLWVTIDRTALPFF